MSVTGRFVVLALGLILLSPTAAHGTTPTNALEANAGRLAAGSYHSCAIKTNGTPVCWGADSFGQVTVPEDVGTVTAITVGYLHTCAIKTTCLTAGWGGKAQGQAT